MILTLCGPRKFEKLYHAWNECLTYDGHIVLSICTFPSVMKQGMQEWMHDDSKEIFDAVHLSKIYISQGIVVFNPGGYVGQTTKTEIVAAVNANKHVFLTEHRLANFPHTVNYQLAYELIKDKNDAKRLHLLAEKIASLENDLTRNAS